MKGFLPFFGRFLFHRSLLFPIFILLFSATNLQAKTVVIGTGSGDVSVTSMAGLNPGDILAIKPGQYSGGSFGDLTGITITNNGGDVVFNGKVTLNTLTGCTFSGFQFKNVPGIAIRWDGNSRRCVEKNIFFSDVAGNCNDASEHNLYNGDTSTLKLYICTFDSLTVFRSGLVMMGSWGDAYGGICFMDSIVFSRVKIDNTLSNGTEIRGTFFRLNAHDWSVVYKGYNPVGGDVGIFYISGSGSFHHIYRNGGRGYIIRLWNTFLKNPGNSYFYDNVDINSTVYGSIDIRTEPQYFTQYLAGGNCFIYNNTSGNKGDNIGYWSSIAVVGNYPLPYKCFVKNNLGFNITTNGHTTIMMNQGGAWTGDSSNNMYYDKPDGVVDPITGIPVANSPVLGKGITIPWLTDDVYHNFRAGAYDIGAVQHGGAIIPPPPDQPPVAITGAAQTITLPVSSTSLIGTSSYDPDGVIISYAWMLVSGTGGTITTPSAATTTVTGLTQGTYIYKLTVTDDKNSQSSALDTIFVKKATNVPPVANAGSSKSITLPITMTTLDGSLSTDPNGTIVGYGWAQISGPSTSIITNAATAIATANSLVAGQYIFELTVTDNGGATAKAQVKITVVNAGIQPPIANAGANQIITLPLNQVNLNGSASVAPSGTIKTFSWKQSSGPSTATLSAPNSALTTASNLVSGTYSFKLTIQDNNNATATDSTIIIVNPAANVPPIANAGPAQMITAPASSVDLNGSGSYDPDGSITAYSWILISGLGSVTINNGNTATPSVNGLTPGSFTFQLTVTDNGGATATGQVVITVNPQPTLPNQAPVANAGNNATITAPVNSIQLDGSRSFDPDGTIVDYGWSQVSGPSTALLSHNGTATPTVSGLIVGTYVFQLMVTDNMAATNFDQVTITVNPAVTKANQTPFAVAGADTTLHLPASTYVLNAAHSYDPDGTITAYQWQEINGPSTVIPVPVNGAQVEITNLQPGLYEFQLLVTDNDGATATARIKITVEKNSGSGDQLMVYPNPAHDLIHGRITSTITGTVRVNVYDMNGRTVLTGQEEKSINVLEKTLNISGLAPGMYTIEVNIANRKTMIAKFIKQ